MKMRIVLLLTAGLVLTCLAAAPAPKGAATYSSERVDPSLLIPPAGSAEYVAAFESGVAKFKRAKFADAAADFQTALQRADKGDQKSAAQLLMALSHYRVKEYDRAESALKEVLLEKDADPLHRAEAQLNLGCVQCHTGPSETVVRPVPPEVIASFEKLVAMKEANGVQKSKAQQLIGKCYRRTHRYAEAIAAYAKVADIEGAAPGEVGESLRRTAECYLALGDYDKAIEASLKLQKREDSTPVDLAQAEYHTALARIEQAKQALQAVLDNPDAGMYEKKGAQLLLERLAPPAAQPESKPAEPPRKPQQGRDAARAQSEAALARIEQAKKALQAVLDTTGARPQQQKAAKLLLERLAPPAAQPASDADAKDKAKGKGR